MVQVVRLKFYFNLIVVRFLQIFVLLCIYYITSIVSLRPCQGGGIYFF
jgi:hypothetical protein